MKKAVQAVLEWVTSIIAQCCTLDAKYVTITGAGDWGTITEIVAKIYDYLAIAGIAFTLVYFLMEVNEKLALEGRDLTMKSFFAPFLKLMVAIAVISQSGKIASALISFSDGFITNISKAGEDIEIAAELTDAMTDLIKSFSFFILLVILIILLLTAIIGLVLKLVWWYKGMMYKLELLFRLSILPIAVADVYGGKHSNAIRYLKGFLALGLYGVALVALPVISLTLAQGMMTDTLANLTSDPDWIQAISCLLMYLVAPFAAIAASNVAKQVSKEALGA